MIPRILEPESMEGPDEVAQYDAMDHRAVNDRFTADFLAAHGPCRGGEIVDVGTGTARIPIALALADPMARIVGVDLAPAMLERAARNVEEAGLADRIRFIPGDAKLPHSLGDARFEAVISNTIIHHIPDPAPALATMFEHLEPGGTLMIRDLARPDDEETLAALVEQYAAGESAEARELFRASLHAALTVEEAAMLAATVGLPAGCVSRTSDRHWTLLWKQPD
ncbi:class I SAM-dependent methyltransferase [Planctomyces sp. SH-PL62]|uniref:class I SAM-dependent methyltransferase n=1 Tax=Planctomyces sp. SH-PL62 TaxID=1636152 RepID=UPI00078B52BD|nr:class I SAM-dependent methyltransferase [Planctomyces sp. SH-PL62]AMV36763.1 Demethylrebeccamycin-D-glucose O-methyltransferase [Planctomyces sp. SH-PL62]